jgi:hypothetical protein
MTIRPLLEGLPSATLHGLTLAVRLAFMLVLLRETSASVLGFYGLLASIELIAIYAAGLELHTFTTRRYAARPSPRRLRIALACHLRVFTFAVPIVSLLATLSLYVLGIPASTTAMACFAMIVATGIVSQEVGRYLVLTHRPALSIAMSFFRTTSWMLFAMLFLDGADGALDIILAAWATAAVAGTILGVALLRGGLLSRIRVRRQYLLAGIFASRGYYVVALASVLQGSVERFVLQVMLGPTSVGIFAFFQTLANTVSALVQAAVLNLELPKLLSAFPNRDAARFSVLRRAMQRSLLIALATAALIALVTAPIVSLTSHPEYADLTWLLGPLLFAQVLTMWTQPIHLALFCSPPRQLAPDNCGVCDVRVDHDMRRTRSSASDSRRCSLGSNCGDRCRSGSANILLALARNASDIARRQWHGRKQDQMSSSSGSDQPDVADAPSRTCNADAMRAGISASGKRQANSGAIPESIK